MFREIFQLLIERQDFFWKLTKEHLFISLLSSFLAAMIGLVLGVIVAEYRKSEGLILQAVNFIYTIPSISMLGFLIPFSGIGNTSAIITLVIYALLPMVRGTYTGISTIDERILEASKGMGSTQWQTLHRIKLPLAIPMILTSIRNMVVMTIALTGVASFVGAGGLGIAIYRGITTNNHALTFAGSLLIALLALMVDFILGIVQKVLIRKRRRTQRESRARLKKGALILASVAALFVGYQTLIHEEQPPTIHIATKPMTEQLILGDILQGVIETHTDLKVEVTQGVGGGTSNIHPGMIANEFDLYPEYTGTGWNMVLHREEFYVEEEFFEELNEEYQRQFGLEWLGFYGFENKYGIGVHQDIVDTYQLTTVSDLAQVSDQLVFGANYDYFEREDGFDKLITLYGMSFKDEVDMDIGLLYQAINEQTVDVIPVSTTDGQISVSDIVLLEDDLNYSPTYHTGNVVNQTLLATYPKLKEALLLLEGRIDEEQMSRMNYLVEVDGLSSKEVAEQFLEEQALKQ